MSGELSRLESPKRKVNGNIHRANKARKRVGRGTGSGHGKTAGRGGKGQTARSGKFGFRGFEGGQMPLQRRLPKGGFKAPFRKEWAVVNLADLNRFEAGTVVDEALLAGSGLVTKRLSGIKILGDGALEKALTVKANRFSKTAREKIEKAGGRVEVI
ncbi:MAG: 50S ribosomal protein L15 [Deltaproteobacteria bacterium]|nr:50S ribosomal protein L15 [Deltaproteobacteria bacterium]